MCRNIKTLANFEPPATDGDRRARADDELARSNEGVMPEAIAPEPEIACAPDIKCQVREHWNQD